MQKTGGFAISKTADAVSPEMRVLLYAIRRDQLHDEHLRQLLGTEIEWPALRQLAMSHGVLPLLYTRLKAIAADRVPPAEMEDWRQLYRGNATRNILLTVQLCKILRLLAAHGIAAIPLKGPALAEALYGDTALRQFSDLDVLVHQQDITVARQVLLDHGYRMQQALTARQQQAHLARTCEFTLVGRDETITHSVDVHFRLAAHYLAARLDTEAVFARRQTANLAGHRINMLAPRDLVLYLCLHSTLHLWARLSNICDIGQAIATFAGLDWPRLLAEAERAGLRRVLLLGLTLAHDLMAVHMPDEVEARARQDRTLQHLNKEVQSRLLHAQLDTPDFVTASLFHLRAKELWADRLNYLYIRACFPTIEDWKWVSLPDRLYALYYFLRPLRLIYQGIIAPALLHLGR